MLSEVSSLMSFKYQDFPFFNGLVTTHFHFPVVVGDSIFYPLEVSK
jgi:hypothetical protein